MNTFSWRPISGSREWLAHKTLTLWSWFYTRYIRRFCFNIFKIDLVLFNWVFNLRRVKAVPWQMITKLNCKAKNYTTAAVWDKERQIFELSNSIMGKGWVYYFLLSGFASTKETCPNRLADLLLFIIAYI